MIRTVHRFLFLLPLFALCGCPIDPPDSDPPLDAGPQGTGGDTNPVVDAEPEPEPPGPMRLVTWNTLDFFDATKGNCPQCLATEKVLTPTQYKTKLVETAKVLRQLAGDVVVLQEIENIGVLDALAAEEDLKELGYHYRKLEHGRDPRGINIGVMSRVPIDRYTSHKDEQFTRVDKPSKVFSFARDAVEIEFKFRGKRICIVGMHLLAKAGSDDPDRRVAEAQRVRLYADNLMQANPNMYVFIMGDMNDTPDSDTYAWAVNGPTPPNSPIYRDVALVIPAEDRYSYVYKGAKNQIDYILADPTAGERLFTNSVLFLHDIASGVSDHRPMTATFNVP